MALKQQRGNNVLAIAESALDFVRDRLTHFNVYRSAAITQASLDFKHRNYSNTRCE